MKTMPVIISLAFILLGECLLAQEDLVVREYTTKSDGTAASPASDILREYNQDQQLISEINLLPTLDKTGWRYDSRFTYDYNAQGDLIHQTKTFYAVNPERITIEDELTWDYDEEGRQIAYQLFRKNHERDIEEGFSYQYAYDANGCQIERIGKTWDQALQQFVLSEETTIESSTNCLPTRVSSGLYSTRYEYQFDEEGRPVSEKTFQSVNGEPEELISTLSFDYGERYQVRAFERLTNDYHYRDSSVYNEQGQIIYRIEASNLYSQSLEPTQEYRWEYDADGAEAVQVRNQSWNSLFEFWETTIIDSTLTDLGEQLLVEVHEIRSYSADGVVRSASITRNLTEFRCDGLPLINVETYEKDGIELSLSFAKEYIYAGPAPCTGVVAIDEWEVYPVPATDELHIRAPIFGTAEATLRLVDIMGQTVKQQSFSYTNGAVLDLSGVTEGVYTLMVDANQKVLTKKVMIQSR